MFAKLWCAQFDEYIGSLDTWESGSGLLDIWTIRHWIPRTELPRTIGHCIGYLGYHGLGGGLPSSGV